MNISIRYTMIFSGALLILAAFNNCSKVSFTSAAAQGNTTQNIPNPNPSPTPSPTNSGSLHFPQVGSVAAVAYEDLYPNVGDADYNDFLTEFAITEKVNTSNQITDIYIDFYPRAVGAGYDHSFLLVMSGVKDQPSNITLKTTPMFNGAADVQVTYYDAKGNMTSQQTGLPYNHDLEVFSSTHALMGENCTSGGCNQIDTVLPSGYMKGIPSNYIPSMTNARVAIHLADPTMNIVTNTEINIAQFRMILHAKPSNEDIDIIDVDPKNFDSNGYPFGFVIPTDWQWMQESVAIDKGYPLFAQYREYLRGNPPAGTSDYMNWFNHPVTGSAAAQYLYPEIPFTPVLAAP